MAIWVFRLPNKVINYLIYLHIVHNLIYSGARLTDYVTEIKTQINKNNCYSQKVFFVHFQMQISFIKTTE